MPVEWVLSYPIVAEEMQNTCRLHFESLVKDAHVSSVLLVQSEANPNIRLLRVLFKDGHVQPAMPSLRFLNLMFPERPLDLWHAVPVPIGAHPMLDIRSLSQQSQDAVDALAYGHRSIVRTRQLPEYLSAEYSTAEVWRMHIPSWAREGMWVLNKEDSKSYLVVGVTAPKWNAGNITFHLRPWRLHDLQEFTVGAIKELFVPAQKPKDPDPWHKRLLDEDPVDED